MSEWKKEGQQQLHAHINSQLNLQVELNLTIILIITHIQRPTSSFINNH